MKAEHPDAPLLFRWGFLPTFEDRWLRPRSPRSHDLAPDRNGEPSPCGVPHAASATWAGS
jgi:hypothetical protein